VTDEKGYSVMANDGNEAEGIAASPLYEGELRDGDSIFRVSMPLAELLKKIELDRVETTPWIPRAMSLRLSASLIEKFVMDLGQSPEKFLGAFPGMARDKAEILRLILFGDKIVLESPGKKGGMTEGAIDLRSLRRSALNPLPDPIEVIFPVPLPWYLNFNSEWFIQIILEHFSFDIEDRKIEFDPLTHVFTLSLNCRAAVIGGATQQLGRIRELYRYMDKLTYHNEPNYLESGKVGPLTVSIRFQIIQETNGLWRMRLIRPEAHPDEPSVTLIPKTIPATVEMTYENEVKDMENKTGAMTKVQHFEITEEVLKVINKTLTKVFEDAFGSSFFPEDLGFLIPLKNFMDPSDSSEILLQGRLAKLKIVGDGLSLLFDARTKVLSSSSCVPTGSRIQNSSHNQNPVYASSEFTKEPWSLNLVGSRGEPAKANLDLSSDFLNLIHQSLFQAGFYCPSTKWIWPRDSNISRVDFFPRELPQLEIGEDSISFELEGSALLWNRDFKIKPELQWDRSVPVSGRMKLLKTVGSGFKIQGLSSFRISNAEDFENERLKEALNAAFPVASNAIGFESIAFHDEWFLKDWKIQPQSISAELVWGSAFVGPKQEQFKRSLETPISMFEQVPPFVVQSPFVGVKWSSNLPEAVFSWRIRRTAAGDWSQWSSFSSRKEILLSLPTSGRYEFQIVAMNSFYQLEDYPKQIEFNVQLEESSPPVTSIDPPVPPVKEVPKDSTVKASSPKNSPGLFGCQLGLSEEEQQNRFPSKAHPDLSELLAALGFLGLATWLRQFRRRLGKSDPMPFSY